MRWLLAIVLLACQPAYAGPTYQPPVDATAIGAQPVDATLTALAATNWAAGTELIKRTAADTFGTLNVGTGASNIVQLTAASKLPAVDGSLLTNLPSGYTAAYDWADPASASGGDQLASVPAGSWSDAGGAFGGAKTVCMSAFDSRLLQINTHYATDCSTSHGTTDRAVGILISVPAGDFTRIMRIGLKRNVVSTAASVVVSAGPVFVDGTTSASAWYSLETYEGTSQTAVLYSFSHIAAAGSWDAVYDTLSSLGVWQYTSSMDFAFVRTGTTLVAYAGPMRGQMQPMASWTVTAGAGMAGFRMQSQLSTADYYIATLYAYRTSLSGVP